MMHFQLIPHHQAGRVQYAVEKEALVVSFETRSTSVRIPFADIAKIHVMQEMPGVFRTNVHHRGESGTVSIPSRHFVSLGKFEDRRTEYAAFVRELSLTAAAQNSLIEFRGGSSFLFWLAATNLAFAAVLTVLGLTTKSPRLVIGSLCLATLAAALGRQGRTKSVDPRHFPSKWMPPIPGT